MKLSDLKNITFADVKEAVKRTANEKPATAAKLAWGAGITVFVACEWMAISRLNKIVGVISTNVCNLIDANNCNANFSNITRIMENNNVRACNAQLRVIGEKLGIDDELAAAGAAASEEYLASLGTSIEDAYAYMNDNNVIATVGSNKFPFAICGSRSMELF